MREYGSLCGIQITVVILTCVDVPSIISGNRLAFLEPQEQVWRGESGRSFTLGELSGTDHLAPLNGIAGFNSGNTAHYPKTLFRFPFRNAASGLSGNIYTVKKVNELINALRSEAKLLLLFLRSVHTIEVYNIDQEGGHTLFFQTKVADSCIQEFKGKRAAFLEELTALHSSKQYNFSNVIKFTAKFAVSVFDANAQTNSCSHWLVANQVDSTNAKVRAASVKQKVFPWVGAAVELDSPGNGRIFCFLPMPIETASNLPVHVNGTFGLNDDRRSLKWPGVERRNDPSSDWNALLVNHVIPACYTDLLLQAKLDLGSSNFYNAWPSVEPLSSKWESLLALVFGALLQEPVIWSEAMQEWVLPSQAVYIPAAGRPPLVVENTLTKCGVRLAEVPSHVRSAFKHNIGMQPTEVTPKLARKEMCKCHASYISIDSTGKHVLLKYCLKDGCYSELKELHLLPSASGSFESFKVRDIYTVPQTIYICTQECPINLLPNLEHKLVDVQHDSDLQSTLKQVARSNCTQLKELTVPDVQSLLVESMPKEWQNSKSVSFPNSCNFPSEWFPIFWNWVQNKQLKMFAGNFILPVRVRGEQHSGHFNVVRLSTKPILYIQDSSCSDTILSMLSKFEILCCLQKQFGYVVHKELKKLTNAYDACGIIDAICYNSNYERVCLTAVEAENLRKLLGDSASRITSNYYRVLNGLKMFTVLSNASGQLFSINDISNQSLLRTPLAVKTSSGGFNITLLPSNIIILSEDDYYQNKLLSVLNVKFLNTAQFLTSYLFPHITNGHVSGAYVDAIMLEVLRKFDSLKAEDRSITDTITNLLFVMTTSGTRKSPMQLFDPSHEDMSSIFAGESVFPSSPYDQLESMGVLRSCGLRTSITAQEVLDTIQSISHTAHSFPQCVDQRTFMRSKAILNYLGKRNFYSQNRCTQCTLPSLHRGYLHFSAALNLISSNKCWLPLCSEKPSHYPKQLPWKGEGCTSHLCTLNSSVSVSSASKASHPILYGSQMYFTEPVECDVLTSEESPDHLVAHLQVVICHVSSFTPAEMMEVLPKLYGALQQTPVTALAALRSVEKWVYVKSCNTFVSPKAVALEQNPNFRHSLEPYLYKLPDSISNFSSLFTAFGVNSAFSQEQIISTLAAMKADICKASMFISVDDCWNIVMAILNWLTENGTKAYTESFNVFVPVESNSEWPELQPASAVTYTDNDFMKKFTLQSETEKPLVFIHSRVSVKMAECLQLVPLSKELDIAADTFEDTGQYEPLTTRLRNILRDYKDGLTIVKELIQNADDAEATEVNICYDARTHSKETDKLFFPGMAESHGPALVIHNNKVFSDEDFENITKLAGATKQSKHLKIGKFGIGFCSVYHITDIPSFLSRDLLYIFDPTLGHLGKEIKNPALPGKRLKFNSRIILNSKQLEPYRNLFGFSGSESYQGTMFRLPFRTAPSELSGKCYSENTALELLTDIYNCSESLVLFLQHIRTITFQRINNGDAHPTTLFTVSKTDYPLPLSLDLRSTSALSIDSKKGSDSKSSKWLVSTHTSTSNAGKYAVANVACELRNSEGSVDRFSLCSSLDGEIFCYLPLSQSTGLPVHVSCNFAVINNRRGIWTSDKSASADEAEVEWNNFLMESVIPRAYSSLLFSLKSMQQNSMLEKYQFHDLWPLTAKLKQQNPWSNFVLQLYEELATSLLFYSESMSEWRSMKDSKFLEPNILSRVETPSCVLQVLYHLKYPIVDLPVQYRTHLHVGDSAINELAFIKLFFSNLLDPVILCSSRNAVVQNMLELYASESDSVSEASQILKQNLSTHACIPCSPDGCNMKMVAQLIHPEAPFAKLYDADEAMFPLEELVKRNLSGMAMKKLGIILNDIPWSYIAERACTVQALVKSNPTEGYKRAKFIIDSITSHTHGNPPSTVSSIDSIEFLPVMEKPASYSLDWLGEGMSLSCGKRMLRTGPRPMMPYVGIAGSQAVFVSEAKPGDKGCSHISDRAEDILGLLSAPSFNSVLAHFKLIISNAENLSPDWISETCQQTYEYLDEVLNSATHTDKNSDCFKGLSCIWTGNKFIYAEQVSISWSVNGPYLYQVPSVLRNKKSLCSLLGIKESFSVDDIQQALIKMQQDFGGKPLDNKCQAIFKSIIPMLHDWVFRDGKFLLPDEKYVLHPAENLAYNDAAWAPRDDSYTYVHEVLPRGLAKRIGVIPVRSKFLDKYASVHGFKGMAFGQHEELTRRIQNILRDYPLDVTILKELLQNADDAKATKMYVILDKRFHGTRSVLSSEWQDLQGPALLVWNDSMFSEKDLDGIQELGLGSKRSDAETIGQYGIGFNVVYHITDCPSFVTNGETLCILDPHCRYVPGADVLSPGRRFDNINGGFWADFPDVESAYLRHGLVNLPQEVLGGSLFRFPIRHDRRSIAHSEIAGDLVVNADQLCNDLHDWMKKMKEAMLFLNNVTELKLLVIEKNTCQVETFFHYHSKIADSSSPDRVLFRDALSTFKTGKQSRPLAIMYPLTLTEVGVAEKDSVEQWLIQQGVGDIYHSDQYWKYVDTVKPRHGIAAPLSLATKREDFKGQIFCFLPLPVQSGLPVHVNGHFILNSTRRELWKSTDIGAVDDRSKWNNSLVRALSSSYADSLLRVRTHYVAEEYRSICTALNSIEHYYSLFPISIDNKDSLWNTLARDMYKVILERNLPVLCVLKSSPSGEGYTIEWRPPKSSTPADRVYYWNSSHYYTGSHKKVYPILERIGMKITPASSQIMSCFNTVLKEAKSQATFSSVTRHSIFDYYTKCSPFSATRMRRATSIADTAFRNVSSFVLFTKYILENQSVAPYVTYYSATKVPSKCAYPSSPFSHYLLLTADGILRQFEENNKILIVVLF